MIRAGVLMPRSTLFPAMGLQWLSGLKANLELQGLSAEVELFTDNIGFGIHEAEIYAKVEKMILERDIQVLVVFADMNITEMLQPLFTATQKLLLVVNFGANFPDNWQPAPTTIVHSLNFCMHTMLTGELAAAEGNRQAVNVVSYYDGGYRQCFAMLNAHQQQGGVAMFNHVTGLESEKFSIEPVTDFLQQHDDVRTLLCLFAGSQAESFYKAILPWQEKLKLRLFVSPMMLDRDLMNSIGSEFRLDNIRGFIPWHASLENEYNTTFNEAVSAKGSATNYFSLLGWETGQLLAEIITRLKYPGGQQPAQLVQALTGITIPGPRGWLKIDAATQHSYGPAYLAEYSNNRMVLEAKSDMEATWAGFTKIRLLPGERSGWRNTYLCI